MIRTVECFAERPGHESTPLHGTASGNSQQLLEALQPVFVDTPKEKMDEGSVHDTQYSHLYIWFPNLLLVPFETLRSLSVSHTGPKN